MAKSDPDSSEDELVVEEEPVAPKAEPGTRPAFNAASPAMPSFPPHEHVIDADEQQWVYYNTRTDGELVGTIASTFEADTDEVIESNVSRYSGLRRKSKLKMGTLLVIGACDTLLLCSKCRCDERKGDPILICRENCGRGYHRSCLKLARVPDEEWQCHFCAALPPAAAVGAKRPHASPRVWYKRQSGPGSVWERMEGDDGCHGSAQRGTRTPHQRARPHGAAAKVGKGAEAKGEAAKGSKARQEFKAEARVATVAKVAGTKGAEGAKGQKRAEAKVTPQPAAAAAPPAVAPGASAAAETAVAAAAAAAAAVVQQALPHETFIVKVARIKALLDITDGQSIPAALREANGLMGLPGDGTLPAQVDTLLRKIFS